MKNFCQRHNFEPDWQGMGENASCRYIVGCLGNRRGLCGDGYPEPAPHPTLSKVILIILLGFELHPMLVLMYLNLRQRQETTTTCRMQPPSQWRYELLPWPLKLSYNCLPRPHTFHYIPIRSFVYTHYANTKKTTAKCTRRLCR